MANNIKGITIQIGGDTTGLDKALKGVNGQAREAQNELKEVNKALKLDPKNVELLEQKQPSFRSSVPRLTNWNNSSSKVSEIPRVVVLYW